MSLQTKFSNFHDIIKLSREADAYKSAREKDESILIAIKLALKEAGYPVIETFLQGSMAVNTAIKHKVVDFDIDRAIVIDTNDAPDNPLVVKEIVLKVLENRGFKNAKIKKPCITANYGNLNLHIDIAIYRKNQICYELAVGKRNSNENNREWSNSSPKELLDHINDKSSYFGSSELKLSQYKRLVRYLKRWRDNNFSEHVRKKLFSIGLTTMAKKEFQPNLDKDGKAQDLEALRDTVERILQSSYFQFQGDEKYKISVQLPVSPYRDIFDGSGLDVGTQAYNKMSQLLSKLNQAASEQSLPKQCEIMQSIFGEDFEVPESEDRNSTKAAYITAGIVGTSQGA